MTNNSLLFYLIELVIYNVYWYQYFWGFYVILLNYTVLTLAYEQQKFIFSVEIIDKNKVGGTKFDIFIYTYLRHKSLNYIIECWVYL